MNLRIKGSKGLYATLALAGAASGALGSMSNKYRKEKEKRNIRKGFSCWFGFSGSGWLCLNSTRRKWNTSRIAFD